MTAYENFEELLKESRKTDEKISDTILNCGNIGWDEERIKSYQYNPGFCKEYCILFTQCKSDLEELNQMSKMWD